MVERLSWACLYMLPLVANTEPRITYESSKPKHKTVGILLERTYAKKGQYSRVGYLKCIVDLVPSSKAVEQAVHQAS
jgi:hypothetical protein